MKTFLLSFVLALPAFCACPSGVTHIVDTLLSGDGTTPAYGKILVSGPSSPAGSVVSSTISVTIGTGGSVDFCLAGGVASQYTAAYLLTTSTGRATNSYTETWIVPNASATLTIKQLWGGSAAPQYLVSPNQINPAGLTAGQLWQWDGNSYVPGNGGGGTWGSITGTLSAQTDLNTALGLKAPRDTPVFTGQATIPDFTLAGHTHLNTAGGGTLDAAAIASGIFPIGRIPTGTSGTTVALGNHTHTGVYQPVISLGSTSQYFRGDLSLGTFATDALTAVTWSSLTGKPSTFPPPNPSSSTLGGVQSIAPVAHQWLNSISTAGVPALSQPAATDVTPTMPSTPGTMAVWDMVQGASATTLYDKTANGNNGTLRTAALPTWTSTGLAFTSTQIVDLTLPATSPMTIITALTPSSFTGTQVFVGATNVAVSNTYDGIVGAHWSSRASYAATGVGLDSGNAVTPAIHASVRGSSSFASWTNGAYDTAVTETTFPDANALVSINNLSFPFTGTIHYMAVFNKALTDAELLQWYQYISAVLALRGVTFPARTAPTTGVVLKAFGDSITANVGASDAAHAYVGLIGAAQGSTIVDAGISGSQITTQIDSMYATTVAQGQQFSILTGYNDMRNYGTNAAGQLTYQDTLRTGLAFMAIPETAKVRGSSATCTYTGTWTTTAVYGGIGKNSTTSGATAQCPFTGSTLILGYIKLAGTAGTFSVAVDGVTIGTVNANAGVTDGNNRAWSAGEYRVGNLTNAAHTVTLTQLSGTVYLDWLAGLPLTSRAPTVYVGNTLKMDATGYTLGGASYAHGSDTAVAQFNAIIASTVATLAADGLNVKLVDVSSTYNPLTAGTADDIHPGDVGHAVIANAFLGVINAVPSSIPTTLPPSGAAGGSLSGFYPNPTVNDVTESWVVGSGGVTANTWVKMDTSTAGQVIAVTTSDVAAYGVALSTAAAGGTVLVRRLGSVQVTLDSGTAVIGNAAILSTTAAGNAHDSGLTRNSVSILNTVATIRTACASSCSGTLITLEITPADRGTQIPTSQVPNVVDKTLATSYTAGAKQSFQSSSTTAGMNFGGVAADPSVLSEGDTWYRTDLHVMRQYQNGVATTIGGPVTAFPVPTFTSQTINSTVVTGAADIWLMQEGSGTTFADSSGTANTVTAVGGVVAWQSGPGRLSNGSLVGAHFNGAVIATAANRTNFNPGNSSPFTACGWYSFDSLNSTEIVVAQYLAGTHNVGWFIDKSNNAGGDKPDFTLSDATGGVLTAKFNYYMYPGTLYHVCATHDGTATTAGLGMYVDGVSQAKSSSSNSLVASFQPNANVTLGGWSGGTLPHTGWIANVQIYNRVLTATEVGYLYQTGPVSNTFTQATRTSAAVYACTFATCDCVPALRTTATGAACTDNTDKLQSVLWTATQSTPLQLIVDGYMGMKGLLIRHEGYTSITGLGKTTGFFVLAGSNSDGISNGWSGMPGTNGSLAQGTMPPKGSNVTISNLYLDGNKNTAGFPTTSNATSRFSSDAKGKFCAATNGLVCAGWFVNIALANLDNINMDNVWDFDPPSYGKALSNVSHVFDNGTRHTATGGNTDGIHINGPADHISISNCHLSPNDDAIALNAPEGYTGAIDSVTVTNCEVNAVSTNGAFVRAYAYANASGGSFNVSNVVVSNSTATVGNAFHIGAGNGPGGAIDALGPLKFSHIVFTPNNSTAQLSTINDPVGDLVMEDITVNGTLGTGALIGVLTSGTTVSNLNLSKINIYRKSGAQTANYLLQVASPASIKRLTLNDIAVTNQQGQSTAAIAGLVDIPTGGAIATAYIPAYDPTNITSVFTSGSSARVTNIISPVAVSGATPAVTATSCTGATIGTGATNLVGTITGLPTGACSVVLTFASATAAHGWSCAVSDQTTSANLFQQSANTTTSVTFAGTSVSGDVLSYGPCAQY